MTVMARIVCICSLLMWSIHGELHGQELLDELEDLHAYPILEFSTPQPDYPAGAQVDAHEGDSLVLVTFYNSTGGPTSWINRDGWLQGPVSDWQGISLDTLGRVLGIDLRENRLTGSLPSELGALANLEVLNLGRIQEYSDLMLNEVSGPIPPELGQLTKLKQLILSSNQLEGEIPSELSRLTSLEILDLYDNQLTSTIPPELGMLTSLEVLDLSDNQLTGTIPPALGMLTNLTYLYLAGNQLTGTIPVELTRLTQLQDLRLHANELEGGVPPELGSLTSLTKLLLSHNNLTGLIPPELGELTALQWLNLGHNNLTGVIPEQLGELTELRVLHLGSNNFAGSFPIALIQLPKLEILGLYDIGFSGPIPPELGRLTTLQRLYLSSNDFTGSIPLELTQLSALKQLWLASNDLTGPIPPELGELLQLEELHLSHNNLNGTIPRELGQLTKLDQLRLYDNYLSGSIPSELGNLRQLEELYLYGNGLSGSLPPQLGQLQSLRELRLHDNNLSGTIPPQLGQLTRLRYLRLDNNTLSGPIPPELGQLESLRGLNLDHNQLSRPVPNWTGLNGLTRVRLQSNQFLFADLLPNADLSRLAQFTYAPQDSIGTQLTCTASGYVFTTPARAEGNEYQWYRNGQSIAGAQSDTLRLASATDLGDFHARITNEALPDLTLYSRKASARGAPACGIAQYAHVGDSLALVALYNATDGPNAWLNRTGWLREPVSKWHGIVLDTLGRVTHIILRDNLLSGSLPSELGELANLQELDLGSEQSEGFIAGAIPAALGMLTNLTRLDLGQNRFTGTIPLELTRLTQLEDLDLANNRLSGQIPPELSLLINLKELNFAANELSGNIPSELGQLTKLVFLSLPYNKLTGVIPVELGQLVELTTLYLNDNTLSGPIFPALSPLVELRELFLRSNNYSGAIPQQLGQLSHLERLFLENNKFSGPIPPELGQLAGLRQLALDENNLSGSIPPELGQLDLLELIHLNDNQFSGLLPDWTELNNMRSVHVHTNRFLFADLLPNVALTRLRDFTYAPQDSIDTQQACSATGYVFSVSANAEGNQFQWFINGEAIPGEVSDNLRINATDDPAYYHASVTNDALPDLTLFSRRVRTGGASGCTTQRFANVADSTLLVDFYNRTHGSLLWHTDTGWLEAHVAKWYGITLDAAGRVTDINLPNNNLVGQLPLSQLDQLPNLSYLDVSGNEFSGIIPKGLGALTQLEYLDLSRNTLAGEIPKELAGQAPLKMLDLGGNQLVGAIPTELSQISTLQSFSVSANQLAGPVPAFTGLDQLDTLHVAQNAFLFMDLLPNASLTRLDDFVYAPQDSVETLLTRTASGFALTTAAKAAGNRYQWYRDDQPISGPQSDTLQVSATSDPAQYHATITNDRLPDLTLVSRKKGVHDGLTLAEAELPQDFLLHQSYPNPFAEATTIAFELGTPEHVRIVVYDLLGKAVATIADGRFTAGVHRVVFAGDQLASGQYMYRMEAGAYRATRFMSVVR